MAVSLQETNADKTGYHRVVLIIKRLDKVSAIATAPVRFTRIRNVAFLEINHGHLPSYTTRQLFALVITNYGHLPIYKTW